MKIKYVPFIIQETGICKSFNLQQKTSKRTLAETIETESQTKDTYFEHSIILDLPIIFWCYSSSSCCSSC